MRQIWLLIPLLLAGMAAADGINTTIEISSGSSSGNSTDYIVETIIALIPTVDVMIYPASINMSITFPTSWSQGMIVWDYPHCQNWGNINFTVNDDQSPSATRTFACDLYSTNKTWIRNVTGNYLNGINTLANFTFNNSESGTPYFVNCTATVSSDVLGSQTEAIRAVSLGQPWCAMPSGGAHADELFIFIIIGVLIFMLALFGGKKEIPTVEPFNQRRVAWA